MEFANLTGNGTWAISATGFSNPQYLSARLGQTDNSDSTGFDISTAGLIVVAFTGTYTGGTVIHEQTLDPSGATGWFTVNGSGTDGGAASSTGSTSGLAYVFSAIGVKQRIRVTGLSTGAIEARVLLLTGASASSAAGGGGGSGSVGGTANAADPTLSEGATGQPFSLDLSGHTRVIDQAVLDELGNVLLALQTPAASIPPQVPLASSNATFSRDDINLSAVSGDQTIVAAVASQSTRVHGLFITCTGGASESLVTVKAGATAIGYFRVPTTGLVVDRRDLEYWLYKTGNNEAFILSPSVAINIAGDILFVTSA